MSASSCSNSESTESTTVVKSGLLMETRSFSWKVDNFDMIRQSVELVQAQKFLFRTGSRIGLPTRWECFLFPYKQPAAVETEGVAVGVFYRLMEKPPGVIEVNASFVIKIKNSNGEEFFSGNVSLKNMADVKAKEDGWGYKKILEGELPLVDGCLIIETEFKLYAPKPNNDFDMDLTAKLAEFKTKSMAQLRNDFGRMQGMPIMNGDSKIIIISKDEVEFPVIREILAARSRVFEAMLQSGMKETQTGTIKLDDLNSDTVKVLLHYIYTGSLHKDWKNVELIEEFTYAVHKYELHVVIEFLDGALAWVCTAENAGKLAVLAKKLSMKKAEESLLHVFKTQTTSVEDIMSNFDLV